MNLKKTICEAFGKNWGWCDYYWDTIKVCAETNLLANNYCPTIVEKRVHKEDKPTSVCSVHHAPTPPMPKWKICTVSGLEATKWCPTTQVTFTEPKLACRRHLPPKPSGKDADFIIFSFDFLRPDVTEDELMDGVARVGAAGCDYNRTFLAWPGDGKVRYQPFLSAGSSVLPWDITKFNPEWTRSIQRFQRVLAKCGMGLMMDFFGLQVAQMGNNIVPYAWFVKENNINNIDGYKDTSEHAMYYWKWCLKQVMDMIGVEGNLVKLGNEQKAPGDGGSEENSKVLQILDWVKKWALPLSQYLRNDLKIKLPLSSVAEPYHGTGHCIASGLSDAGWEWPEFCGHWHGCDLYENWEERFIVPNPEGGFWHMWAVPKYYGISDDGGGHNMPVVKRGVQCANNPARWSANQNWRIDTVKRIKQFVKHIRFIEWMPMEFKSDTCRPGDLNQSVSVDVYWKCAQELWGIDIRRVL